LWGDAPFDGAWSAASALDAVALHPAARAADQELVRAAHRRGLAVYVWTVNAVERTLELVKQGVDGVMSDFPGRLLEARARLLGEAA
jgi:glycerophosphoryl diester phosphodiesterase